MAMTKKHYIAVAGVIKHRMRYLAGAINVSDMVRNAKATELEMVANDLAAIFKADNGAFRHDTFMSACGFDEAPVTQGSGVRVGGKPLTSQF